MLPEIHAPELHKVDERVREAMGNRFWNWTIALMSAIGTVEPMASSRGFERDRSFWIADSSVSRRS